jgi:hypothetical protein
VLDVLLFGTVGRVVPAKTDILSLNAMKELNRRNRKMHFGYKKVARQNPVKYL